MDDPILDDEMTEEQDRDWWLQQRQVYMRKQNRLEAEAHEMAAAARGIAMMLGLCPECGSEMTYDQAWRCPTRDCFFGKTREGE